MNSTGKLYGLRRNGLSHGDVFTSPQVVCFMLDMIGYTSERDLSTFKILEPSFGQGDFLIEIQHRLIESAKKFNFDASAIMSQNVYGCEIDENKYKDCIKLLRSAMPDFVPLKLKNEDFLFSEWDTEFDFIIGNPPYIRYENIPLDSRKSYKAKFKTFHYRCDLYVLFYEHSLDYLSKNGIHCFICSNRWLKNEYGKKLRALISSCYKLEYIIDVENLNVFKESVLAYPSITLISNTEACKNVEIATVSNISELKLPLSSETKKILDIDNWDNLFVNNEIEHFSTIEEQGFKVGIGVATGADKIFISAKLKDIVESEILLPIVNARDLTGNEFNWRGMYVLNPYNSNGDIIDLNTYPRAKRYLESVRPLLENRHIVKKGHIWYSLIDKVKPNLLKEPKILLPDISGNDVIFVDTGLFYPAHNIYYITGKLLRELELLAAILMSRFVRSQIEHISNKMNGGLPRWQSQSIKRIRIPIIASIPSQVRDRLVEAYNRRNIPEIDTIVEDLVKFKHNNMPKYWIPKSLFDYDYSGDIAFSCSDIH